MESEPIKDWQIDLKVYQSLPCFQNPPEENACQSETASISSFFPYETYSPFRHLWTPAETKVTADGSLWLQVYKETGLTNFLLGFVWFFWLQSWCHDSDPAWPACHCGLWLLSRCGALEPHCPWTIVQINKSVYTGPQLRSPWGSLAVLFTCRILGVYIWLGFPFRAVSLVICFHPSLCSVLCPWVLFCREEEDHTVEHRHHSRKLAVWTSLTEQGVGSSLQISTLWEQTLL